MVMRELVDYGAPLELVCEADATKLYADEMIAALYEGYTDMAEYHDARMRGREDIASVLSGAV